MSEPTPDLGTAWRLLDEARAELNRVTAERDELSARLADAVSPTAQDYDNAAEILKLRGEVAELRRTIRNINDARYATDDDEPEPAITGAGTEHLAAELAEEGR